MRNRLSAGWVFLLVSGCHAAVPLLPGADAATDAAAAPADVPSPQLDVPSPQFDVPSPQLDVPSPQLDVRSPQFDVPTAPVDVPTAPVDVPTAPADVPTAPVDVPTAPVDVPTAPADVPTAPVDVPTAPVDVPVVRRRSSIGVFRPSDRTFTLDLNGNDHFDGCGVDRCLPAFTAAGDIPVVGDWSGSGRTAIGTYRTSDRTFTLDFNHNGTFDDCSVDRCITGFGSVGDQSLAGDWAGTGRSAIGVFHRPERSFGLDANGDGVFQDCAIDRCIGSFGETGVVAIVGDWAGTGRSAVGIFRPTNQTWTMDRNNNGFFDDCTVDRCTPAFGLPGDRPVVGDWSGTGRASIGVFRPSTTGWVLDANDNGLYDGCAVDRCVDGFGLRDDLPVIGNW